MANVISFDETILWTIGGIDYHLKKPSIGAIASFSEEHGKADGNAKAQLELTVGLLGSCGLPGDVCLKLNAQQLELVVNSLVEKKKG